MFRSLSIALIASVAVSAVISGAVLRGRTLRAARALRDVPRTARAVLRIDPDALRRSSAAQGLVEALVVGEPLSRIEADCGLDPLADLSEAILWVRGSERQPLQSFGLMLTGSRVDADDLAACHARLVTARGGTVVRLEVPTGPVLASEDGGSASAILDGRTIVTGSAATVAEALAVNRDLLPALGERAPVAALWPELSRGAAVAAVLDPPDHWRTGLERVSRLGAEDAALEGIRAIGLRIDPDDQPETEICLDFATKERARRSAELVRSWAASPPDSIEPPWDSLLRSARVRIEGPRVRIAVELATLSTPP